MATPARRTLQSFPITPGSAAVTGFAGLLALACLLGGSFPGFFWLAVIAATSAIIGNRKAKRAAELYRIRTLRSTEIARYHAMAPTEFEHAIAFLCQRDGCSNVQVVGGAGDLGADVIATTPDGRRIVIQCKRYGPTTKVGSPDMQRFGGTCWSVHRAHVAAVVTTSVFTKPAANYGVQHGIRLIDVSALGGWATRTGPAPWM
ncbi:restriction endonuclease [Streptomyces sp. NPDC048242]|uniref:restriction endonuclease n=1 Tax=Streptomyces sp. NPDC048242 TaxID=3155026 RepID=UPI00342DA4A8